MAWGFIQSTGAVSTLNSSVVGVQFATNVAAGNTLTASATWGNANVGSTYTDSLGNVFTVRKEINDGTNSQSASIADCVNIAGGASSVVAHFSAGTSINIVAHEYSGILGPDVSAGNVAIGSTATNNVNSTLATTTVNNDLLHGVYWDISGTTNTLSAGTGFTIRLNIQFAGNPNPCAVATEDQSQAAAGSTRAIFTQKQAHRYIAFLDALKPTVAGAGVQHPEHFLLTGTM